MGAYWDAWLDVQERKAGDYFRLSSDDDSHDNEADGLRRCPDCKGRGWYVGATVREHCKTCDGSGWL